MVSHLAQQSASWLTTFAAEPALVVLLLAALAAFVVAAVLLHLRRSVRAARARGALADWVLGAEDALAGALADAHERLQRVVQQDAENHGARTLLAETLLLLDQPAAAHEHFVTLRQAFGVDNRRVAWGLVRALAAAGRAADAAERVAALPRVGEAAAGLRQRLAIELAAGLPEEAVRTASVLLPRLPDDAAGGVRMAAAHAHATLRRVRTTMADAAGADAARREALAVLQGVPGAAAAVYRRVLALPPAVAEAGHSVGVDVRAELVAATPTRGADLLADLAADVVEAPFVCPTCGMSAPVAAPRCPHCAGSTALVVREPGLHRELGSAAACSDEIEETEAHLQRLVDRCLAGDGDARDDLLEAGGRAVPFLYRRALTDAAARAASVAVLQAMGSGVLEALLAAYDSAKVDPRLGAVAREAGPDIVGRIVRTFGPAALPAFQAHLDTDDRDLRKIVIDFYLGLDDPDALQAVLDRYPPVEVIQRLNATPPERLQAWLQNMPSHGFVAEVLLAHPMFLRDEDVLLAAARASSPASLLQVLARRGPSHDLATFAVDHLGDVGVAGVAQTLLRQYGLKAADALLAGYLDLDRTVEAREAARALLAGLGAGVVPMVCLCLGASPSRLDDEIVSLLCALGDVAVDELQSAYAKRNLLERVAGRLVRRYNHPRNTILKVLARIGGERARAALAALRVVETDPNLKLRLDQALQVAARPPSLADGAARDAADGASTIDHAADDAADSRAGGGSTPRQERKDEAG